MIPRNWVTMLVVAAVLLQHPRQPVPMIFPMAFDLNF